MSEVRKWLDSIGLAQYADAFETNDLDIDLLGQVDDQLLKDIGVSSAGHRLRIRNAIAKLSQQETSVSSLGAATDAASASAERRQVTVMFSDLAADALEVLRSKVLQFEQVADELAGTLGNHNAVRFRYALQARGEVRRLANNASLLSLSCADQVPDDH